MMTLETTCTSHHSHTFFEAGENEKERGREWCVV